MRSGHVLGAVNLYFKRVLEGSCFKNPDELRSIYLNYNENTQKRLVFMCGSGVTACIILFAAYLAGFKDVLLYDGSWSEWESDKSLPIELSNADENT